MSHGILTSSAYRAFSARLLSLEPSGLHVICFGVVHTGLAR
jgi:hypothetical protein